MDAEYSSYFEDENNNELEDSISDPDYDVTADPLAKAQWMRDMFEEDEEDFSRVCQMSKMTGKLSPTP